MEELYLYALIFIGLYVITRHFLLRRIQNLPPSPFPAIPVLGHLPLLKEPVHRTLAALAANHGPVILLRLGSRPVLLVSSPSAAEDCLHHNDIAFANRPHMLQGDTFGYNYSTMLWAPYGNLWRSLRRIASTEVLSSSRLQVLTDVRADEVRRLVKRIYEGWCKDGDKLAIEMKSALFELTNNVMMRMIAGKRYYGEEVETEDARRCKELVGDVFQTGWFSTLRDFMPWLRYLGVGESSEKVLRELQGKADQFFQERVDELRTKMKNLRDSVKENALLNSGNRTMIEVLLSLQEKEPEYYTDELIKGLVFVLLLAGTDTSSSTMEWALSHLINNPKILRKAQLEIDTLIGDSSRLIRESDIKHLPYLHCIINETLRITPVSPLFVPHESSDDCIVGGYKVPRGTMLFVNAWAIHNDPTVWDDPGEFKPERFEGVEGDRVGFKLMPFGSGRRVCPGEGLAMRVVSLALGTLLQCFEWENAEEGWVDMEEFSGITMPKAKPLLARARPRKDLAQLT